MSTPDTPSRGEDTTRLPRDPLESLVTARENLQTAEVLLEEAKADLSERLHEIEKSVPEATRVTVLNEVYWRWPALNTHAIAEAFGYKPSDLRRLVKPHYSEEHPCLDCGAPLLITSRSKMVEIERVYKAKKRGGQSYDWYARCERCEAKRKETREAEWQASSQRHTERLRELATMPYREYLQTPEWQARRQRHLRSAGYRCQLCNSADQSLHVHHRTYERRGNERWADLLVLCADCHDKHHDKPKVVEAKTADAEAPSEDHHKQFVAEEGFAMIRSDGQALYATFGQTAQEAEYLYAELDPEGERRDEVYPAPAVRLTDTNIDYEANWPKLICEMDPYGGRHPRARPLPSRASRPSPPPRGRRASRPPRAWRGW